MVRLSVDVGGSKRALAAFEEALIACREAEAKAFETFEELEQDLIADTGVRDAALANLDDWQRTRAALERMHAAITTGEPT